MLDTGRLHRNWKGYLVWAKPCRCATTNRPGWMILILTGRRSGEQEWRPAIDWDREPHPGIKRYEPVPDPIPWCPFTLAQAIFRQEFPDAPSYELRWVPGHDCPGACYYRQPGEPRLVALNPNLTLVETVGVILHELAHVAVGPEDEADDHGPLWQAALDRLEAAWAARIEALKQLPGLALVQKKE